MARKEKIQVVVPEAETPVDGEQPVEDQTPAAPENSLDANRGKSAVENPVSLVWKTCDEMEGARRKDVVEACIVLGVNVHTARTQYQRWYKAQREG